MKNILILEDNMITRRELSDIVKEISPFSHVYETDNSREALDIANKCDISLFIVDISLVPGDRVPDSSGADFAVNIREISKYAFTPIVIVSVFKDRKNLMYSDAYIYRFIDKPYDRECAKNIIRETLQYEYRGEKNNRLIYNISGLVESVDLDTIMYVKGVMQKICIKSDGGYLEVPYNNCRDFLKEANDERFVHCSRNLIVNVCYIDSVDLKGGYLTLKSCKEKLKVSRRYKKELLVKYKERLNLSN